VVLIRADPDDLPYCQIHTDDRRADYVAMRHLLDRGCPRIALVWATDAAAIEQTPPDEAAVDRRLAGARRALEETGLGAPAAEYAAPCTVEGGRAIGEMLLDGGCPLPDGIFVTNDIVAAGIPEVFRSAGLSVPEECAIVAHDGLYPAPGGRTPALSTIAPPSYAILRCGRDGESRWRAIGIRRWRRRVSPDARRVACTKGGERPGPWPRLPQRLP